MNPGALPYLARGIAGAFAVIVLFVVVIKDEQRREYEYELVRSDPVAAADDAFAQGSAYFYHWQHEQAKLDGNGEVLKSSSGKVQRERVWTVIGEDRIAPLLLEAYPERRDLIGTWQKPLTDSGRIERRRAFQFGAAFNERMAELCAAKPLPNLE